MVDLTELARLHEADAHPHRLTEVFGDGVLMTRIPALGRLRELVKGYGYRFVRLETLPDIYSVLPLVLLPEILDGRVIPYRANAAALLDIAASTSAPIFDAITFEDISPLCLIHHESAHALFFEVVREHEGAAFHAGGHVTGTREAHRLVAALIESEGFALGLDIFVTLFVQVDARASTRRIHSISTPSHTLPEYERRNPGMVARLAALAAAHPAAVLKLICTGAYIANLRPRATNQVSPKLAERCMAFARMPDGFAVEGRELLSVGMTIDYAFRQRLAPTLFRYIRIEHEFEQVLATSLETALTTGGDFDRDIDAAIATLDLATFALPRLLQSRE
jgi:hypothetical protein